MYLFVVVRFFPMPYVSSSFSRRVTTVSLTSDTAAEEESLVETMKRCLDGRYLDTPVVVAVRSRFSCGCILLVYEP